MPNHPPQPDAIDRRTLLMRAASGLALAAGSASAIEPLKTSSEFAVKASAGVEAPNLHPPVVQVKGGSYVD